MDKILSVSIAAYNVEKYLKECLEPFTVSNEVLEMCEVLIVDDGSKDNTAKIAGEFVEKYPDTFKLIQKENGGWGSTVNAGIKNATGKYFKLLDGDDYLNSEAMLPFCEFLKKCYEDIVMSQYVTFEDKSNKKLEISNFEILGSVQNKIVPIDDLGEYIPSMHEMAVKTEILKKNNVLVTEHCFYTDVEYMIKAIFYSETMAFFCDEPIYYYRISREGQSVSIEGKRKHYKEHTIVTKKLFEFISDKEDIKQVIQKIMTVVVTSQYHTFFLSLEPTAEHRREMAEFDRWLKKEHPEYYIAKSKKIWLLRKSKFLLYYPIAKHFQKKFK